jgi:hypothetical protein
VLSLEVVEHVYFPHRWCGVPAGADGARRARNRLDALSRLLEKNLALSLVPGACDRHHHPLRDHGRIKFWSARTLRELLIKSGFQEVSFTRVERVPALAKSIVAAAGRCA